MSEVESKPSRLQKRIDEQIAAPSAVRRGISLRTIGLCAISAVAASLITILFCRNRIDWELVQLVHGTFWAALIVGPITFFGVLLTNHSHDRRASAQIAADQDKSEKQLLHDADRLAMQLDHAANEALLERESDMRRDVYLEAAAELVRANAFIGSMFSLDFDKTDSFSGMKDYAAANAKVLVVADPSTATEAQRLATMYGKLFLLATPIAQSASRLNAEAKAAEARAEQLATKLRSVEEEFKLVQPDPLNPTRRHGLADDRRRLSDEVIKAWEASANMFQRVAEARRDYQLFLRPHLDEIGNQQTRVLACLRRELGLEADEERMLEESKGTREEVFGQVDSLMYTLGMSPKPENDDDRDEEVTAVPDPA